MKTDYTGGDVFARINFLYSQAVPDLREIAHIKRFLERYTGDHQFRTQILAGVLPLSDAAKDCGCDLDVEPLRPVFHPAFTQFRAEATLTEWPLTFKWDLFYREMLEIRDSLHCAGDTGGQNLNFDLWRQRNIARTNFELAAAAQGIVHPTVAFELSSGCSVGCWFCGISAKKFGGHFALTEAGRREWEDVLVAVKGVVGPAMRTGFLYWATDPLDNPDYIGFLKAYREIIGIVPQTTTAIPLRNVELTRQVLEMWRDSPTVPNRFSILSTGVLRRVHETFTPEELLGVELVLQNKKSEGVVKFLAGRGAASKGMPQLDDQTDTKRGDERLAEGTIACVTGFLFNIVERTVRLISPTIPSIAWPDGYIVFDTRKYERPADLPGILADLVARYMRPTMQPDRPIRFTEAVRFDDSAAVPTVSSKWVRMASSDFADAGRLIRLGSRVPMSIYEEMCDRGSTPVQAMSVLDSLWKAGLLRQD
jgi:radical SAM family RiPP maturation amino acid epimerase